MSSAHFHIIFIVTTSLLYFPAAWMKITWSRENYSQAKYLVARGYSMVMCIFHLNFVKNGEIFFIGVMENSVMGWVSMGMSILHAFTVPSSAREPRSKPGSFDPRL